MTQLTLTRQATTPPRRHAGPFHQEYEALLRRLKLAANETEPLQIVGVTSCSRSNGGSTIAANLAIHAACRSTGRVLLIDAHVEQPSVHRDFRVESSPGLVDVLGQRVSPHDCMQESPVENVWILPSGAGRQASDPAIMQEFLATVRHNFEWIIVDLGPVADSANALTLSSTMEGVLLVVEAEKERVDLVQAVKEELLETGATILGVVFNKVRRHIPRWLDSRV